MLTAPSSLVILVFEQLAVSAGESVTRLTEKLQGLLLVDVAKDGLLRGKAECFWENTGEVKGWRHSIIIFLKINSNRIFLCV